MCTATPRQRSMQCVRDENCRCTSFHGARKSIGPACSATPSISCDLTVTLPWQIPRVAPLGLSHISMHARSYRRAKNSGRVQWVPGTEDAVDGRVPLSRRDSASGQRTKRGSASEQCWGIASDLNFSRTLLVVVLSAVDPGADRIFLHQSGIERVKSVDHECCICHARV